MNTRLTTVKPSPNYVENLEKLAIRTIQEASDLERVERETIARYRGQFDELENAIGMLRLGHHLGWRVLVLIHNKRTIKKYEAILQISVREFFPEIGPSAERSFGYKMARKLGNFWKVVSGEVKVERRREISD